MATAAATTSLRVGFVGIGNMGAPMARNLAKSGFATCIFDVLPGAALALSGEPNIEVASSLADLARGRDLVITMLPDGKVVQAAALGEDGFARHMPSGGLIVDMSSSFPLDTQTLQAEVDAFGLSVVDAPVSGGVTRAVSGTLAIMAGGVATDVERALPVLSAMGTVHRTGLLGSGHAMKALNNYLSAASLIATSEALIVGEKFGLDPKMMIEVLNASTGRSNTTENKGLKHLVPRRFDSGFTLALLAKDVGMAARLASDLGINAADLEHAAKTLDAALDSLGPTADHTAVIAYAERRVVKT